MLFIFLVHVCTCLRIYALEMCRTHTCVKTAMEMTISTVLLVIGTLTPTFRPFLQIVECDCMAPLNILLHSLCKSIQGRSQTPNSEEAKGKSERWAAILFSVNIFLIFPHNGHAQLINKISQEEEAALYYRLPYTYLVDVPGP